LKLLPRKGRIKVEVIYKLSLKSMNKRIILPFLITLVALILLILLVFCCFIKNESKEQFVVSGHPAWPPIMYQEGDKIVGAGPEIVAKIFTDLGIQAAFKYEGSWNLVQDKAKTGSVDVLVAAYKTAERETYMDYSIPYTIDPIVLVVKKGRTFTYDKWEDLLGKRGVVTIGDSYGQDFDNFIKENLNPQEVETPAEAFALLDKEEVDYFVYALYSAEDYIFKNKISEQVEIIPQYVSSENFYLTISKKSSLIKLLPEINSLLEKYKNDGTIDQVIESNKQALWDENEIGSEATTQLANPASTNCIDLSGNLVIQKRGDGGEYGLCYFEDNRACEEWALLRGECPVGGAKTTGLDTIDQQYCVWTGGQTTAVSQSVCVKNEKECPTLEYYNGECSL
jgi:polar amino acid transport system substrate-binding protein